MRAPSLYGVPSFVNGFVCKWVKRKVTGPHAFRLPDGHMCLAARCAPRPCAMLGSPSCVIPSLRSNASRSINGPNDHCGTAVGVPLWPKATPPAPDGWSCDLLLALPPEAWDRLRDVLSCCERLGRWPQAACHWRVAFLPKDGGESQFPAIDWVRPISVGAVLYRVWASARAKTVAAQVVARFHEHHAGATWVAAEVLLLLLLLLLLQMSEICEETNPEGVSLDLAKAFDRVTGLAQGDAFAPLALSAFLCAPFRQLVRPQHFLYTDARTSVVKTVAAVEGVQAFWEEVCRITGMQNNLRKVQVWFRPGDRGRPFPPRLHAGRCSWRRFWPSALRRPATTRSRITWPTELSKARRFSSALPACLLPLPGGPRSVPCWLLR